ncbi:fungal specific transcription factor [Colletotrichum tamarilloi]|uniref:Fungal specific transcription factor n=1 Tax=Colletotrichum tamarilloi TaxID=1209934 RepID=A0ABQ9QH16_9PEZI|nr:fungal specific transcription factor [Colletotrichum tamarilloi]KAK1466176.1 fungal specific transcription factor [Colletotrichum tamarilloi]
MDDDRPTAYDGSDGSRASKLERSSSLGPEYSHLSGSGSDSRRDSRQASSFTAINAAAFHQQAVHEGYAGTVSIDSYVQQNQGQRFGAMLEDIQEFTTGGMVCAPNIGDWVQRELFLKGSDEQVEQASRPPTRDMVIWR